MPSYVNRVLQPDESVRYSGTLHWIIFVPGIVITVLGLAGFAELVRVPHLRHRISVLSVLIAIALIIGIFQLLNSWIRRQTTEISVTDRRVIYKTGLVSRRTVEMNMDKVESVDVSQGVLGRVFDYGTVVIRGTGAGLEPLSRVAAPIALRNAITAR
jgi:uncharacterized membrane protein YdbT with pleckstrin-like domain